VKIPIKNVFYLLAYAWNLLEHSGEIDVGMVNCPDIENLLAVVLASVVKRVLRRGLERDYQEYRTDSRWIRGRIDFHETNRKFLQRRAEVHIVAVELSPDTLSNRIVKGTIATLMKFEAISSENREKLAALLHGLRGVATCRISVADFNRVRLHVNNREYRVLLSVCEMIARLAIPDESGLGMRFVSFTRSQMWRLFQQFLYKFYLVRLRSVYSVNPDSFAWFDSWPEHKERVALPRLNTDFVLVNQAEKIIVDAKYYSKPFATSHGNSILWPHHINQVFAYMQNLAAREINGREIRGILLYAGVSGSFSLDWRFFGHKLTAAGVDLSEDWPAIETQLLNVVSGA